MLSLQCSGVLSIGNGGSYLFNLFIPDAVRAFAIRFNLSGMEEGYQRS